MEEVRGVKKWKIARSLKEQERYVREEMKRKE